MDIEAETDKGICILSFDSGGSGSYSQFLLVRQIMRQLAVDLGTNVKDTYPADYFDLIGGVGFGGLAAFMLGHLRMTVDQARNALLTIGSAVFPCNSSVKQSPEVNMQNLKASIEAMLEAMKIPLATKMHDKSQPAPRCRVALYAATSSDISHPRIFRNYASRASISNLNPTIVEALCATIAHPSFFSAVKIGPHMREQEFVGGALGGSNPTRELLKEAAITFGDDTRVAQIISLGSGKPRALSIHSIDPKELTSHTLKSLFNDCETVATDLSTRLFNIDAYVRLNVPSGVDSSRMDDWNGLAAIEQETVAYLETAEVTYTLEESAWYLQNRFGTATLGQINRVSTVKVVVKTAPPVSPHYVIRQQEWETIRHHLIEVSSSTQKVFSITGMAGCGKTQLVSYFLQEMGSKYAHAIFVDASSLFSIKSDLQAWARSLGNGHEQDVWEDALRILSSDTDREKWILILDNADDPKLDLAPFLPRCYHGTVIITSRNRDAGDLSNTHHLELGEMREEEATSALLKAARRKLPLSPEEVDGAHMLTKQLGYLAVALVQAGTYCHQLSSIVNGTVQPITFTDYAALFSSQRAELMKNAQPLALDNYRLGAYTAFDLSYKALPQRAKDFLHFTSGFDHPTVSLALYAAAAAHHFIDPECILPRPESHDVVTSGLEKLLCVDGKWSEIWAHEAIHTLRSFSLISASSVANVVFLHLHPLVHAWAKDKLSSSQHYGRMATQILTTCADDEDIHLHHYILPHIQNIVEVIANNDTHANDQFAAGYVFTGQGYYDQARRLFISNLKSLGPSKRGSKEALLVVETLATAYFGQGKWNEAKQLRLQVLEWRQKTLGREHPDTLGSANKMAPVYIALRQYKDAEVLLSETLELSRRSLGQDNPATLIAAGNLASVYDCLGRSKEAEALGSEVLAKWRRLKGNDDQSTIFAAGNLASTYQDLGRFKEAEPLRLEAFKQAKRLMGKDHPDTIKTAANLATVYVQLGRHQDAEELGLEVLEQRRRLLGQEHPDTLDSMSNLAVGYMYQSEWGKAEPVLIEALAISMGVLGTSHPSTQSCARNLGHVLKMLGKGDEARDITNQLS